MQQDKNNVLLTKGFHEFPIFKFFLGKTTTTSNLQIRLDWTENSENWNLDLGIRKTIYHEELKFYLIIFQKWNDLAVELNI